MYKTQQNMKHVKANKSFFSMHSIMTKVLSATFKFISKYILSNLM